MTTWSTRSPEERALLNPGFCSLVLWSASSAYANGGRNSMPFDVAFLVLPLVLHKEVRDSLPRTVATSVPVWLAENPHARVRVPSLAKTLLPFTREALVFGGVNHLFDLSGGVVRAFNDRRRVVAAAGESSPEVRTCVSRASLVGKWLGAAGSPETVMALFGVRP
jgi:hypothetical protein